MIPRSEDKLRRLLTPPTPPLSPHTKPGASQGEVIGDSIRAVQREVRLAAKSGEAQTRDGSRPCSRCHDAEAEAVRADEAAVPIGGKVHARRGGGSDHDEEG